MTEKIIWKRKPSDNAFFSRAICGLWLMFFLVIFILGAIGSFSGENTPLSTIIIRAIAYAIFLYLIIVIYLWAELRTCAYTISTNGLHFNGGILIKKQKFVPYQKITNFEVSQNIIEQIFGIKSINFQTAGTGGQPIPEIVFEGLDDVETPVKLVRKHLKNKTSYK